MEVISTEREPGTDWMRVRKYGPERGCDWLSKGQTETKGEGGSTDGKHRRSIDSCKRWSDDRDVEGGIIR